MSWLNGYNSSDCDWVYIQPFHRYAKDIDTHLLWSYHGECVNVFNLYNRLATPDNEVEATRHTHIRPWFIAYFCCCFSRVCFCFLRTSQDLVSGKRISKTRSILCRLERWIFIQSIVTFNFVLHRHHHHILFTERNDWKLYAEQYTECRRKDNH